MTKKQPTHLSQILFPVENNCLTIGGKLLTELVEEVGQTPLYVYDRNIISKRIESLRNSLPKEIEFHYAMKANPMPELVNFIATLVDGLDVASQGELKIALNSGMTASEISFAGPGKREEELAFAIESEIEINVESEKELERISQIASTKGMRPKIALRVNPDFELKLSGMKMGGRPTQFGIDAERIPGVLDHIKDSNVEFQGFHIFSGSQNLRAKSIIEAQQKTISLAINLSQNSPSPIKMLNIGGGFGIPYFKGDDALDLIPIGDNLELLIQKAKREIPEAKIIIELGRYIVGEAGIYVCKIIDKKLSRGQVFLITDGGLHHHLAASGNFGQVLRKNYPVLIGNNVTNNEEETVSIVGPLCTPLDLLADKMEMSKATIGDLVVVLQSGAYGLSASPTAFLGHPPPKEILI